MKVTLLPGRIAGEIGAIPSKSHLHRLLIYAAFSDADTLISSAETHAEDIQATIDCLTVLGAEIGRNETGFWVSPVDRTALPYDAKEPIVFPCGESGSTLRFMLPVVCALGLRGAFEMKGRLPQRPLAPLDAQLTAHGISLWRDEDAGILHCDGQLQPADDYELPGDVSSQYISGLLMALPLLNRPSRLTVTAPIESADYVVMTLKVAEAFCGMPEVSQNLYNEERNTRFDTRQDVEYKIRSAGIYETPGRVETEGDWSNAAFWLCAGAMPQGKIKMSGLLKDSTQGDRQIFNILLKMGVDIVWDNNVLYVKEAERDNVEIDAAAIPDLIPVLAAVASVGKGTTVFRNASRLRIKESDRLATTTQTLRALGADIRETSDGLTVTGVEGLSGGVVDAHGDHRIAMMAAIASAACRYPVSITGAQAVKKSYPDFWKDLEKLGKKVLVEG